MLAVSIVVCVSRDTSAANEQLGSIQSAREELVAGVSEGRMQDGPAPQRCPHGMVLIDRAHCIDAYEASLVRRMPDGTEQAWPYYQAVPPHVVVRAVSRPGTYPQAHISGIQARAACEQSAKRLCKPAQCNQPRMRPTKPLFPHGTNHQLA